MAPAPTLKTARPLAGPLRGPTPAPVPPLPEIACWRLVPAGRGTWQGGLLAFDEDLGGWTWDDGVDPGDLPKGTPSAYWTPPLIDAHTHLGDAFLRPERDRLPRDLASLVGPGGYKHRRLGETDARTLQRAMRTRLDAMARLGTTHTIDFREGGADGAKALMRAAGGAHTHVSVLARPASPPTDRDTWTAEVDRLTAAPLAGIGLSALRDLPAALVDHAAEACRATRKRFALHLSEAEHEDMETALQHDPALLVHLVHATPQELAEMADAHVMAVTCPTSNRFFGMRPPIAALVDAWHDHHLPVAYGTDNAMLSDGDLKDEARTTISLAPKAPLSFLLTALTWTPWHHLDLGPDPTHPGLLWGIHRKAPSSHPDETPLARSLPLFADGPFLAPRL